MVRSILPVHWVNLDKETEPEQVLELDHNFSHSCDDKKNTANISFFLFQESGLRPDGRVQGIC